MAAKWSVQLEEHFGVTLPSDVRAWFDDELWMDGGSTEYSEPTWPEDLLRPQSSAIWGGQMLPDTIPILGNGGGDCLCLRFDSDGKVSEVVRWLHELGEWGPYGKTLSDALVLDAVRSSLESPDDTDDRVREFRYCDWAMQWLEQGANLSTALREAIKAGSSLPLEDLLRAGIAEDAVRGMLCEDLLTSDLVHYCIRHGGQRLADNLRTGWQEVQVWLFDTSRIPQSMIGELAKATGIPAEALLRQDWDNAASLANEVVQSRTDLAWPFAVLGWAQERAGNVEEAIEYYFSGIDGLGSAVGFTDSWRVDRRPSSLKFAISRLVDLERSLPPRIRENGYMRAVLDQRECPRDPFLSVRKYWLDRGDDANRQQKHAEAYRCFYRSGWDLYCTNDMEILLDRLIDAAESGGSTAWAKLARQHRQSLPQ